MHMLKIRCIAMDQYGKNNWVPFCFLAWTFRMHSRKQCWNLDPKQRYPNSLQFFLYFVLSSPNQKNCTIVDAKCSMFLRFSQQTLVYVSKVLKTLYQPFAMPCFPYQILFFFLVPIISFWLFGSWFWGM